MTVRLMAAYGTAFLLLIISGGVVLTGLAEGLLSKTAGLFIFTLNGALCAIGGAWALCRLGRRTISTADSPGDLAGLSAAADRTSEPLWIENKASSPIHEPERRQDIAGLNGSPGLLDGLALLDIFMPHLPAVALLKNREGRYLYASAGCERILQKTPGQIIGLTDTEIWPTDLADKIAVADRRLMQEGGGFTSIEKIQERSFAFTRFAIAVPEQAPLSGSITIDVTDQLQTEKDRMRLERQLVQMQKLEAIGTLASGISHDFNNVLGAIFGYVELASMDTRNNQNVQRQLEQVLKAAHRAKDLVRQILTFSRNHEHERKPLDVKPLVKEALKLLRASLPSTIAIRSEWNTEGALVLADATQMHQLIINLCINAAQAMGNDGGELTVDLRNVAVPAEGGKAASRCLELSVQATRNGLAEVIEDRTESGFDIRMPEKENGLGLTAVTSIIKSHGGSLTVSPDGARYSAFFPVIESVVQMPDRIGALPCGTESVLFVDDEAFLVDLSRQMLSRLGYRVVCTTSSLEALQLIRAHPERFDLLITDLTMPHLTGEMLVQQVAAIRPDLPAILCTGYAHQIKSERTARLGIHAFLMKPLTIGDLALTIREVLDRNRALYSAAGNS